MADAQTEQHAGKAAGAGGLHLVHHLAGDRLAHQDVVAGNAGATGGAGGQRVGVQPVVEVGHVRDEPRRDELADELVAQAVDVHRLAADPVAQALVGLRGAVDRDAAVGDLALLAHDGTAAAGATVGHAELGRVGGTQLEHGSHDLGNDVAGLVDDDRVAHADVLALDLVLVVQGCAGDGGAGDDHRVELGDRRQDARAADLDADLAQHGALLLGRELERDGPARRTRGEAEGALLGERVDLHDDAVDVVVEIGAVSEGLGAEVVDLARAGHVARVGVDRKAAVTQPAEEVVLGGDGQRVLVGHGVDERLEVARTRDLGVLLAQAARGGVSGVGKRRTPGLVVLLVKANEAVARHVDLAADLDAAAKAAVGHARHAGRRQGARDVADGQGVGGDVLAGGAVAAGGGAHQVAVAVGQRDAQAVDLELAGVRDGLRGAAAQGLLGAREPLVELLEVHRIVDGVHALGVADGLELLGDIAAHALGVAVRGRELGMGGLDGLQLDQHPVELGIGDLGGVERVVRIGRPGEKCVELSRPCRGGVCGCGVSGCGHTGVSGGDAGGYVEQRELVVGRPAHDLAELLGSGIVLVAVLRHRSLLLCVGRARAAAVRSSQEL